MNLVSRQTRFKPLAAEVRDTANLMISRWGCSTPKDVGINLASTFIKRHDFCIPDFPGDTTTNMLE